MVTLISVHQCFNTQPPEGGWRVCEMHKGAKCCFNTQPPEGGWNQPPNLKKYGAVSTHSRLKAAVQFVFEMAKSNCRFNTQPPEGGWTVCTI